MEIPGDLSTFSILLLGFVLGLRHATEADHLAAVSTIVGERKSLFASSIVGGLWGVGHTLSLFVVGLGVIFLKLQISERAEVWLESLVGLMLVVLGLNALLNLLRTEKMHAHAHDHGGMVHVHLHTHERSEDVSPHHRFSPRSVVVGMVHGLAGSAALMLLVVPAIESPGVAIAYILTFGVGSIAGMMVMSFLIGLPFHYTAGRWEALNTAIRFCAGLCSVALGGWIILVKLNS